MAERLQVTGVAMLILVLGMGIIVAATEYEVDAGAASPPMLMLSDVVFELNAQGLTIVPEQKPAHHPLLGIAGTTIWVGTTSIDVYVYPDVAARVHDEQVIQRQILQLQALTTNGNQIFRVTSARNVLLLLYTESSQHAASIHDAVRRLSLTSES